MDGTQAGMLAGVGRYVGGGRLVGWGCGIHVGQML